ncbi:izumo sperm-egg fusion protein 2 [Rhinoderma darwinii]|uniref:izumo sperm-egg fusion protein 2 n=1 Tax=Rhinoderma darwinii TaxID=43563 RepID=UPI003F6789CA
MAVCFKLFILASFIPMASSCLQCNSNLLEIFGKIRTEAIPIQIRVSKLRNHCYRILKGIASNFFKDYAVNHFTGIMEIHHYNTLVNYIEKEAQRFLHSKEIDEEFLDALVNFRNETTMKFKYGLKIYRDKACSPTECGWLKMDVISCSTCKTVKPSCLSRRECMANAL